MNDNTLTDRFAALASEVEAEVRPVPLSVLMARSHRRRHQLVALGVTTAIAVAAASGLAIATHQATSNQLTTANGSSAARAEPATFQMRAVLEANVVSSLGTASGAPRCPKSRVQAPPPGKELVACSATGQVSYRLSPAFVTTVDIAYVLPIETSAAGSGTWKVALFFNSAGMMRLVAAKHMFMGHTAALLINGVVVDTRDLQLPFTVEGFQLPTSSRDQAWALAEALTRPEPASRQKTTPQHP
jgi:hypothetical protein